MTNGIIEYIDKDGKSNYVEIEEDMITSFNTETSGTRDMIISYNNCTILVKYTVSTIKTASVNQVYYALQTPAGTAKVFIMFFDSTTLMLLQDHGTTIYDPATVKQQMFDRYNQYPNEAITTTESIDEGCTIYTFTIGYDTFTLKANTNDTLTLVQGNYSYTFTKI